MFTREAENSNFVNLLFYPTKHRVHDLPQSSRPHQLLHQDKDGVGYHVQRFTVISLLKIMLYIVFLSIFTLTVTRKFELSESR